MEIKHLINFLLRSMEPSMVVEKIDASSSTFLVAKKRLTSCSYFMKYA